MDNKDENEVKEYNNIKESPENFDIKNGEVRKKELKIKVDKNEKNEVKQYDDAKEQDAKKTEGDSFTKFSVTGQSLLPVSLFTTGGAWINSSRMNQEESKPYSTDPDMREAGTFVQFFAKRPIHFVCYCVCTIFLNVCQIYPLVCVPP